MPNLSVRRLDKLTYEQLALRAKMHGVSMEEEARQILASAVAAPERISKVFQQYFGKENGVDLMVSHPRKPHEPLDFNE